MERLHHGLMQLASMGIQLNPRLKALDLTTDSYYEHLLYQEGLMGGYYTYLLYLLGCWKLEKVDEEWVSRDYCDQVWYRDGETDADVPYGDFVKRLNKMSGDKFDFTEIENINISPEDLPDDFEKDALDFEYNGGGYYGCSFKLKGKLHQWLFEGEDDWMDPKFFDCFFKLIKEVYGPQEARHYLYFGFAQGVVFVYTPIEHHEQLIRHLTYNNSLQIEYYVTEEEKKDPIDPLGLEGLISFDPADDFSYYSQEALIEAIDEVFDALKLSDDPKLLAVSKRLQQELDKRGSDRPIVKSPFDTLRKIIRKW